MLQQLIIKKQLEQWRYNTNQFELIEVSRDVKIYDYYSDLYRFSKEDDDNNIYVFEIERYEYIYTLYKIPCELWVYSDIEESILSIEELDNYISDMGRIVYTELMDDILKINDVLMAQERYEETMHFDSQEYGIVTDYRFTDSGAKHLNMHQIVNYYGEDFINSDFTDMVELKYFIQKHRDILVSLYVPTDSCTLLYKVEDLDAQKFITVYYDNKDTSKKYITVLDQFIKIDVIETTEDIKLTDIVSRYMN